MALSKIMLLGLLIIPAGCSDADPPGQVEVSWRTVGRTCEEVGISKIQAELYAYSKKSHAKVEGDCTADSLTLSGVSPGEYALVLKGLQADGCWIRSARHDVVTVTSDKTLRLDPLPLVRRSRTLHIEWPLPGGCTEDGVEQVLIEIDIDGRAAFSLPHRCADGPAQLPGVTPGSAHLLITGFDSAGSAFVQGETTLEPDDFEAGCQDEIEVSVPMSFCLELGC